MISWYEAETTAWSITTATYSATPEVGKWTPLVSNGEPEARAFLKEVIASDTYALANKLEAARLLLGAPA